MRGLMARTALVAWALALASCQAAPSSNSSNPSNPTTLTTGTDPAQKAEALRRAGVSSTPLEETGLRPAPIDTSKRFEYADVYVSLGDPNGQRQLAQYFFKQDVWSLDKFESLSDTLRHYRFRRLLGTDGKALPYVDPFAPRQ
jgi:hypothetical protein